MIAGILAKIRTEYLPNIGLERYRHANPLGHTLFGTEEKYLQIFRSTFAKPPANSFKMK
jgi:hypothetical protein